MSAKKATTAPRVALLTSCSVSRNYDTAVKIGDAPICRTMDELLGWWLAQMNKHKGKQYTPGELYAGIGFWTVTEIAQIIGHENIYIVTGGVGLVSHETKIVPYDFTSSTNHSPNAPEKVTGEKFLPHVWWAKINEHRHTVPTPIASVLSKKYDIIVGALPKMFIKYIQGDLEACGSEVLEQKVFIPIPQSMSGSVKANVRMAFVPYHSDFVSGLSINRVNKSQAVAKKFIENMHDAPIEYANQITHQSQQGTLNRTAADIDYDGMFLKYPQLLEPDDPGLAIHMAKALGLKVGGKIRFTGAWRGARGRVKVSATKSELSVAQENALRVLQDSDAGTGDDEVLRQIGLFVEAVRGAAPDKLFTAKDVAAWGRMTYSENGGDITSATKLTYVLSYNARYLGIELVTSSPTHTYKVTT